MKYLVIDLEMCRVPEFYQSTVYRFAQETIQIGAVLLDEEFREVRRFSQYVHPRYGALDSFITNLTGIRNSDLKDAPPLEEALGRLVDWIDDPEYVVFAWSTSDRNQLMQELRRKNLWTTQLAGFMAQDRWVDYQYEFMEMFGFRRRMSLAEALFRAEIDISGRLHDGLDDAANTAALIAKLETDPDFELSGYTVTTSASGPAVCTLGDLWPVKAG